MSDYEKAIQAPSAGGFVGPRSPLVLIDCQKLADAAAGTVMVPLVRFFPACTCEDFASAVAGRPCPKHQPEEFAVFGEVPC